MSNIPANAIINSASLSLYSKPNASHGWTGQPTAGADNSTSISRITNAWTTSSISTSSWPSITTQNQVILTQSPTNNHSYLNIDVKNLVQDLITTNDFGLFLRHINTPYYNSLIYYSAEETDTSKHPKLELCYTIPGGGSSSGGGNPQYCESSFKFNGTPTNTVVKIDPKMELLGKICIARMDLHGSVGLILVIGQLLQEWNLLLLLLMLSYVRISALFLICHGQEARGLVGL